MTEDIGYLIPIPRSFIYRYMTVVVLYGNGIMSNHQSIPG